MYRRIHLGSVQVGDERWTGRRSATMLNDGRILFAGGISGSVAAGYTSLGSAEIYDPVQNKFPATGNMLTARAGHSAMLLNNGDVMIIGGATGSVGGGTTTRSSSSRSIPRSTARRSIRPRSSIRPPEPSRPEAR